MPVRKINITLPKFSFEIQISHKIGTMGWTDVHLARASIMKTTQHRLNTFLLERSCHSSLGCAAEHVTRCASTSTSEWVLPAAGAFVPADTVAKHLLALKLVGDFQPYRERSTVRCFSPAKNNLHVP